MIIGSHFRFDQLTAEWAIKQLSDHLSSPAGQTSQVGRELQTVIDLLVRLQHTDKLFIASDDHTKQCDELGRTSCSLCCKVYRIVVDQLATAVVHLEIPERYEGFLQPGLEWIGDDGLFHRHEQPLEWPILDRCENILRPESGWIGKDGLLHRDDEPLEWTIVTAISMNQTAIALRLLSQYDASFSPPGFSTFSRHYLRVMTMAIRRNNLQLVQHFLGMKNMIWIRPNHPFDHGLLATASLYGQLEIVKLLLQQDRNPLLRTKELSRALLWAARCTQPIHCPEICSSRREIIRILSEQNLCLQSPARRRKILIEACTYGCLPIVSYMLDMGTQSDAKNEFGSAFLHAATHGHIEIMEYLLERGTTRCLLFNSLNRAVFHPVAASLAMLEDLATHTTTVRRFGPLETCKAEHIYATAKLKGLRKTVELLDFSGFRPSMDAAVSS